MKTIETLRVKNRIKISNFISGLILILFFAVTILPVSASEIEASREISAGTVYAGGTFTVTVHIWTDQYIEAPTLDENLPDGWNISIIESDGAVFQNTETFKESTLEWIWVEGLQPGRKKTVVYRVTVPSASEPGNFTISGNVSAYSISAVPVIGASGIIVIYPLPEAGFSANPLSGIAPLTVQFTDLSTNNPDSWEWDFDGNGSIDSSEINPSWTYEIPGTYTVTLIAANTTYGNDTETKTGYITVTEKNSYSKESGRSSGSSGSSGGGGGGGSPESTRNIELKEISNEQVFKGIHTCYTFKGETNEIITVEFDPKKNFGKTPTIVEMLKNTSVIVKEPAPGTVYKNLNIWVGNSGFSSSENLENARISFRVKQTWLSENGISENTMTLYRYSNNTWNALPTTLTGKDQDYFYFTAETPGFSPFAISSPEKNTQVIVITPIRNRGSNMMGTGEILEEDEENLVSNNEKAYEDSPGTRISFDPYNLISYLKSFLSRPNCASGVRFLFATLKMTELQIF
ncbi:MULTISPECIES: PGF-pre-PGF domain-containing protein [unclassified Methanosarcina]|uniref:PGF-pre-PGF domain-containing protein n=1 Tax=unclassified Methanosarcina TaxID=2644672 RepID=UPI0009E1E824|nr:MULTISPECIES: PGF-pre-PGF domain-containing protein [unclassified Methanosarcina]